jgi:hypothetical protein
MVSQRKKRQRSRRPADDALVERVRDFLSDRPGVTLEAETSGDWNNLGFTVTVPSGFSDREIFELGNLLRGVITAGASELDLQYTWSVGIYRDGELVKVLSSKSGPERMCTVCGYQQEAWLGDVCLQCESAALS